MEAKWTLQDMVYVRIDFHDTLLSENGVTNCDLSLRASFLNSEKENSDVRYINGRLTVADCTTVLTLK